MNMLRRPSLRSRLGIGLAAAIAWSVTQAGVADVVNTGGWSSFAEFWTTAPRLESSGDFLRLTWESAHQTLALALLGTALAVAIGLFVGPILSRRVGHSPSTQRLLGALAALPRSVHEILIALLLVQVFGFDPIVAVLAIGVPFGAVTAKVVADAIDDADRSGFDSLRATGADRTTAIALRHRTARSGGVRRLRLLPSRVCDPLGRRARNRRCRRPRLPTGPELRVAALPRDLDPDRGADAVERGRRCALVGRSTTLPPPDAVAIGAARRIRCVRVGVVARRARRVDAVVASNARAAPGLRRRPDSSPTRPRWVGRTVLGLARHDRPRQCSRWRSRRPSGCSAPSSSVADRVVGERRGPRRVW